MWVQRLKGAFVPIIRSVTASLYSSSVIARLDALDPKAEPSLQPLVVMRSVDLICHLWQQYVNIALFPLASSSVTIRREMVVFNNQTISRLEGAANQVMQRITDGPSASSSFSAIHSPRLTHGFFDSDHRVPCSTAREAEEDRLQAQER